MTRKRRIDVNDIIGQVFNGMKVNKYVGDKEKFIEWYKEVKAENGNEEH